MVKKQYTISATPTTSARTVVEDDIPEIKIGKNRTVLIPVGKKETVVVPSIEYVSTLERVVDILQKENKKSKIKINQLIRQVNRLQDDIKYLNITISRIEKL